MELVDIFTIISAITFLISIVKQWPSLLIVSLVIALMGMATTW
jgi:hypothetical protein